MQTLGPEHATPLADLISRSVKQQAERIEMGRSSDPVGPEITIAQPREFWRLIIVALRFYSASALLVENSKHDQ